MAANNFLPDFDLRVTYGTRKTLRCLKRGRSVSATPEEKVRQRILNYLLNEKEIQWPELYIEIEKNYSLVGDPKRTRIRSDIELLDPEDGRPFVVIECKAPGIPLGGSVEKQATEYANKAKARYIWISNGEQHKFFERSGSEWKVIDELPQLKIRSKAPSVNFSFPDPNEKDNVNRWFKDFEEKSQNEKWLQVGYEYLDSEAQDIALSFHKILFGMERKRKKLPYSYDGVHVLEDLGVDLYKFGNAGGGSWMGLYADFVAATSGRVEALSITIHRWEKQKTGLKNDKNILRLCVGARKTERIHHALQMDLGQSKWNERRGCWEIFCSGKMSQIKKALVLEAVREAGVSYWLEKEPGCIYLGDLYRAEEATWRNSKKLIANLLHYGIIRSNLRDAEAARRKRKKAGN